MTDYSITRDSPVICLFIREGLIMAKTFFTIEEAASVMNCHPSTIYRLLAEGWLKRPPGWGLNGKSARVSSKSLFQLMRFDSVNNVNGRNYKAFEKHRKNFKRFFSQTSIAKRFSMVKRTLER